MGVVNRLTPPITPKLIITLLLILIIIRFSHYLRNSYCSSVNSNFSNTQCPTSLFEAVERQRVDMQDHVEVIAIPVTLSFSDYCWSVFEKEPYLYT